MTSPFESMCEVLAQRISGELVCASPTVEIHIHVHGGRIAWATDRSAPFAFGRHLRERTSMSRDAFRALLLSCRREALPLGAALVAAGAASLEDIRAALEREIRGALRTLSGCSDGRVIFLEREKQYASYDTRLTFDLEEVIDPPVSHTVLIASRVRRGGTADHALERVRASLPASASLELLQGDAVLERSPAGVDPLVLHCTLLDGADLVALRTRRHTLLGVTVPDKDDTLWCRLDAETTFGTALSALCDFAGVEHRSRPSPPSPSSPFLPANAGDVLPVGQLPPDVASVLHAFMGGASEVRGVLLVEQGAPIAGAVRGALDADLMKGIVQRRSPVLDLFLGGHRERGAAPGEPRDELRSLTSGEDGVWCLAAELPSLPGRTVWLFVERHHAPALGWAYLASLSRRLAAAANAADLASAA